MRQYAVWLIVGIPLILFTLAACQSDQAGPATRETAPPTLSNVPPEQPLNAPDITLPMKLYDANIRDTATGAGGSNAGAP